MTSSVIPSVLADSSLLKVGSLQLVMIDLPNENW